MKAMKQTKQTILQNPLDKLPPNLKKKGRKSVTEPMVLMTAATPASIAQYCIEIPSGAKNSALDEMDMLKNITVHLNQIVQTMEHVYTMDDKVKEEGEEEEETLPHHREDMITFLIICTQLSNQVDAALHEEKEILESLLKWFEKEVQMMEELGEEKIIPDWQIPVADKNITDNINKLMNRIQRLEDLKGRVQELPKYMQVSTPREKRRQVGPPPALRDPKHIIQELALKHATEDVMNMVQVFQDDLGAPQTIESMNNRMVEIMKVFERQTNKLHRVTNEQGVVESKLQKIQHDFQKLAEEKEIMEDEFLKMKTSNITHKASTDTRKTLLAKLEKERAEGKGRAQQDRMRKPSKIKDPEATKMKEDLTKAQANIQSLEKEKKMLEEKLQKVLEEANMARGKLAEIPPDIPDWEFPYTTLEEKEKELSKRTRKGSKVKGKPSAEGTVQKTTRFDIAKAGEALPGKDYETSTAPQAKDGKPKKKGADLSDLERSSLHKIPSGVSEKQPKQYPDAKSGAKPKESVDLRKRRPTLKGTGKESPTALPPLPPAQEKQQLPDSTVQQAKSVEISSEKKQEVLPALTSAVQLQEEVLPVIEPEPADLVSSRLTEPEEFVGESESLEKATAKPRTSLRTRTSFTGLQEDEIKELIDEGMLQLADHLTDLKGMLEAETLARLLLEPSKGLETLSDKQKLQLIRQLVAPDGQQQEQFLAPVEGQIVDEEQREKKRSALANIISTLNLLNQTQTEAGQSEEEANEMAKTRRMLLANLQSNITDLQQAQAVIPVQQELENKVNELTQKRSFLVSALESNLRDLKEAQAIAATQPSEMSKNKVKELLQERAALTACLATNQQKIQTAKAQEAVLAEKAKHEELNALSEKRRSLLAELEKTQNELQKAQVLAATDPSSMAVKYNLDEKIKELTEKRKQLVANIESNLHDLERAQASAPGLAEESRLKQEFNVLSEKRRSLLAELEKNQNELQEAQVLAATEPSSMTDEKIKELTEKRKQLVANIESNLHDLERAQASVPGLAEESRLKQELNVLSEKRKSLLAELEKTQNELQEAQVLAATEPSSMTDEKIKELTEKRKLLVGNIESSLHDLERARVSAGLAEESRLKQELNVLSEKRKSLLAELEKNQNELQEAQVLAATEPSSMTDEKIKELTEKRKLLVGNIESSLHDLERARVSAGLAEESRLKQEVNALSEKRRSLLAELDKNQNELQEAQVLAATEPSSMTDEKIKELTEKRKLLVANIESNLHDLERARVSAGLAEESRFKQEFNALSEKRRSLLAELDKNQNELQEAQVLAATEPSSMTDEKIKELTEKRKLLVANIESNLEDLERAQSSADLAEESRLKQEKINELSQKRKSLLANLQSSFKDLQEAQALASVKPSAENDERIKELMEQRKLLTADLDTNLQDLERAQCYVPDLEEKSRLIQMELDEQTEKKKLLEEKLELNLKNLQQVQMLATEHPNSVNEHKLHELIEEHQHLIAERAATMQLMQGLQREKEFNELSQKKQLLMKNLESNMQDLIEARALVAAEPGSFAEHKLQELIEQRKHLAADLDATVQHTEKLQLQDEVIKTREVKLQELSDKKELLMRKLESTLKELQEAQALESSKPGSVSEQKLQELIEQRRELTAELESAVWNMQELQLMDEVVKSCEKEVHRLVEKKQHLLDDLFSTVKELQEAQAAVAVQPGRICEEKLQVIREKGKQLTADLEGIAHDIKKALYRASGRADLEPPDEQELHDLLEKKQLLLENLKANLKELEEVQALADSKPASLSDHEIQPLNEQRKLLNTCLDTIIDQIKETGYRCIPEMIKVSVISERDLHQLSRYKKLFLETLESNLKDLQDAKTLAAIYPGSGFEQKVLEFAEQRRLLSTGLKAIMEDIEDVESQTPVKDAILKTREIILEELYQKQQLLLEKLEAYSIDLQEAEALAASLPDAENMDNIKTLTEQRRLLATGLEAIMEGIREAEGLDREKLEKLEIIEKELADLSENRQQLWRNVELNLSDLKDLQALAFTEPESMQEERKQTLSEKSRNLATNLEALLQDMAEAQSIISSESSVTSPSGININDLFEIKRLESKLNEVQQMMVLSSVWVDGIKKQLSELKAKRGFDRWDVSLRGQLSFSKEELALYGLDEKATRKLLGKEKWVSPYLQKSFKDLQQRSLKDLQQRSGILRDISDKELYKPKGEDAYLAECLVSIPLKVSDIDATVKYGPDDEQLEKRRALVAKLEANMKELQAFYEAQEAEQAKEKPAPETFSEQLKKTKSPLPLLISKAPVMKKSVLQHEMIIPSISKQGSGTLAFQPEQHKLQKKAMESELRRHIIQQLKKRLPHELITRKHDRNLLQALAFPQSPLQQANLAAAQKLLFSQPVEPGIARFQDYSPQPPRQAWEGNRLPVTDYVQKLMALKKKLLSPDLKELLENIGSPQSTALSSSPSSDKQASMLIRGRAFSESERGRS